MPSIVRRTLTLLLTLALLCLPLSPPLPLSPIAPAHADTTSKTFAFATTAESFVGTSGGKSALTYDSGTGNPAGALKTSSTGRNNTDTSNWTWTGTWESLGVPSGATVTQIRLNSVSTRATAWSTVNSVTIGPYKLQDGSGTDQATLWSGRSPTGVEGSWVNTGAQSDQAVPSAIQASTSTIKLYLARTINLGNDKNAIATIYDDQVSFVITYTPAPVVSISLTTNGSVAFGTQALNTTKDTTAGGLNDVETVSIDSGPADLDAQSTSFSDGGNTWTLSTSSGSNQVHWEFSPNGSSWTSFAAAGTNYALATSVAQGNTQNLYLRLTTPTSTSSYNQHSATVTITASTP